ncbi:MAG: MFS transporter [Spirosomaceae bacterium]|nr:MFS transporter [Spirosomataceae bacterium]
MSFRAKAYPWFMVLTGLMMLTISNGLANSVISLFDKSLLKEFGWTTGELKFREFVTLGISAGLIFFSGSLIDRFGAKRMMLVGTGIMTLAYTLYGRVQSKEHLYAIHGLFALALITAGTISCIVLVSSWFKEKRGLALGITLVGTSMAGFIFPVPLTQFIKEVGWRSAAGYLAILPAAMFVWTLLFVRNKPTDIGLAPYGQASTNNAPSENLLQTGMGFEEARRTVIMWLIAVSGMFTFYSLLGILSNTFLYMLELGYTEVNAAQALTLFSLFSLTGKFVISSLTDYFSPYRIFALCCTGMFIGSLGYSLMSATVVWYAIPFTAFCWGGLYTLYNLMSVKTFGLKSIGKINGIISVFESVGAALGPWIIGLFHDQTGTYQMGFISVNIILFFCALLSFRFKKYALVN